MNPDKKVIVDQLLERVKSSPFLLVIEYTGMTVPQFSELRKRLEAAGSSCHVTKNTYLRHVLGSLNTPAETGEKLVQQTAIVTGEKDIATVAKVVKTFAKEFQKPAFKFGILDGEVLDEDQVSAIAELPPREVLLATLLSTINAPAAQLVRTINEPGAALARVIQAKFNPQN